MLVLTVYDGSVTPIRFKSTAAEAVVPWNTDATERRFKSFMLKFVTQDEADRSIC
jgi:hypothetical protein